MHKTPQNVEIDVV